MRYLDASLASLSRGCIHRLRSHTLLVLDSSLITLHFPPPSRPDLVGASHAFLTQFRGVISGSRTVNDNKNWASKAEENKYTYHCISQITSERRQMDLPRPPETLFEGTWSTINIIGKARYSSMFVPLVFLFNNQFFLNSRIMPGVFARDHHVLWILWGYLRHKVKLNIL